jgi:hypothetical protein
VKTIDLEDGRCWVAYIDCDDNPAMSGKVDAAFSPSTDWAQAGPIFEREDYCQPRVNTNTGALHHGGYVASTPAGFCFYGNTPLFAAMRAYVTDKFDLATGQDDDRCGSDDEVHSRQGVKE